MRHFDVIYIVDLHGNANRQECSPDGSKDENVFDIKQGVCILILVKTTNSTKNAIVKRFDIYGNRDSKYTFLNASSLADIPWQEISPEAPLCLFAAEDSDMKRGFESGLPIKTLFRINGTGVLTKRDELCIHFTEQAAFDAAKDMATLPEAEVRKKYNIPKDVRDWKYDWAKKDVIESGLAVDKILPITYRPFDTRYTYYSGQSRGFMGWPVYAVMKHIINTENIALVTARSNKAGNSSHFFVSRYIVEYKCGERTTNSSVFPLYLCENGLLERRSNFDSTYIDAVSEKLQLQFSETSIDHALYYSSLDLFAYIYAILYSMKYRTKYKDFLNRDFPIIPLPKDRDYFWSLVKLGRELVSVHLLDSDPYVDGVNFICDGSSLVERVNLVGDRVYINKKSYFTGVTQDLWNFLIGGYEVLQRWFKDRKGQVLSAEDVEQYKRIIRAIIFTQQIMREIDNIMD